MWHVSSRSSVATLRTAIHLLLTYLKPVWILLKQETVSGSGISWAVCKSATRSRQITMPAPHHSVFYRPDALPVAQPTASKHWKCHVNCKSTTRRSETGSHRPGTDARTHTRTDGRTTRKHNAVGPISRVLCQPTNQQRRSTVGKEETQSIS